MGHAWAQLPAAQLQALIPAGGRAGTIVEVQLAIGADSDGASKLVFSHPHITAVQKTRPPVAFEKGPQPEPNQFTVAIHPDVPPGMYEARYVGRFGVSNPRSFVVGDLPEQKEPADNHAPDKAAAIAPGVVVNGTADATANDYFKIALKKDQRVVLDCWAERIDSRMDATLAIYDATGRELAHDRDTNRHDPLLAFTAPADGEYVVKLYDFLYRGGNDNFYRLVLTSGAYIDSIFPPVAVAGAKAPFTVYGVNLPGGAKAEGLISRGRQWEQLAVEIEAPGGEAATDMAVSSLVRAADSTLDGFEYRLKTPQGASNPVLVGFASAPVIVEQEPNDDPAKPQPITVPCDFVGRFAARGDYDYVAFEAKKGDVYWIEAVSQRLGLPSDPYLLIQRVARNDKGEPVVTDVQELDDSSRGPGGLSFRAASDDPSYRFTAPDDGTYRILIRDLYAASRGDPRMVYSLAIRRAAPDFRLVAVPVHHSNNKGISVPLNPLVRRGGTEMIDVVALRRDDFEGEIELSVAGLPPGVTAGRALIPAGLDTTTIVLAATEDAAAWAGPIQIVGKAKIGDAAVARTARAAAIEVPSLENQPAQSRLARDLWLAVLDADTLPFLADLGEGKPWETSRAGKLEIPVKLVRRGDFKGPVILSPQGLPPNVKAQAVTIAADASEGKLAVEVAGNARPGEYALRLQAQTQFPYRRDPQSADAAAATAKEIEKIAAELAAASQAAEQAKAAADKLVADAAAAVKQATDALAAETQKATAAAEAAKAATDKAAQAREAAEKSNSQELAQAKEAAEKAAGEAQSAAQAATAAKSAAEKAVADTSSRSKTAADDKVARERVAAEAAAKAKAAADAKTAADKRAADLAKATEPKNVTVFESSTSTILKIAPAPLTLAVTAPTAALAAGGQVEAPVALARLYGFVDALDIELVVPEKSKGLSAAKLSVPAGQGEAKLALAAAAETMPGKHELVARAKFKFNGQDFQVDGPFVVEVEVKK